LKVFNENCVNLMDVSSGTGSGRSGSSSKMEDIISVTITAAEVESIVHKAVSQAVSDINPHLTEWGPIGPQLVSFECQICTRCTLVSGF